MSVTSSRTTLSRAQGTWGPVAAERGGAGGEAAIDMIDVELDGRHPRHPAHRLPFFKPRSPRPGLILLRLALAI